jgi:hypothetical protein
MSNAFTNFLSNKGYGPILKDYQHASRLYVDSTYARAPKVGFLYFVQLNINRAAVKDTTWGERDIFDVGLLVKKTDLPKFTIETETMNQYNRKTVVQKKLSYNPISIDLHDDNSDITHNLWVNYYKNYYADSNLPSRAFEDTKFGTTDYNYGRYDNGLTVPFFDSIDLYVLHQGQFTQYTLLNPKVKDWQHDSVSQDSGNKILQNKFSIEYESVIYQTGTIRPGEEPASWAAVYYDTDPSPLLVGGNEANSPTYARGKSTFDKPGKASVFGPAKSQTSNPLVDIATILAKNYLNKQGLSRMGATGYNIAGSVMGALGGGAGKYAEPASTQNQPGVFNLPGGIGINIFKGFNTSVDGSTHANPASIIFPKR